MKPRATAIGEVPMSAFFAITAIGAVISARFNVLALLVLIVIGAAANILTSLGSGEGISSTLIASLLGVIALQIGYFGGILLRRYITEGSQRRHRTRGAIAALSRK